MTSSSSNGPTFRLRRAWPAALTGASGVLLGLLWTVWSRGLETWCGPTLFTGAIAWLVAALAVAAGVVVARRWRAGSARAAHAAAWAILFTGLWGLVLLACTGWLARIWMRFLIAPGRSCGLFLAGVALAAGIVVALPLASFGFALGMGWGSANRPVPPQPGRMARRLILLAVCAVAGGWCARAYALPLLGCEAVLRLAAAWAALLAGMQLWLLSARATSRLAAMLAVFGVPVLAVALTGPREPATALGFFGRWASRDDGFVSGRPLRYMEGRRQSVAVYEHPDFGRVLLLNGAPVAYSDRYRSARILAAHLPLLLHPEARSLALVGPAAGIALPSAQTHPLAAITVFAPDVEPARWAREFLADETAAAATTNANRRRAAAPAVTFRQAALPSWWARRVYDVVLISGGPVWDTAAAGVLRPGVLQRCRRAAADDGLVALQFDTRGLSGDDFRRALRQFHAVFPHVQVWCIGAEQWLLVGRNTTIKVPVDRMLERLDDEPVFHDLVRAGVRSLPEVLACFTCDTAGVDALTSPASPAGVASMLRLAWHALRSQFDAVDHPEVLATVEASRSWRLEWLLPGQLDPETFVALLDRTSRCIATRVAAVDVRLGRSVPNDTTGKGQAELAGDVLIREALEHLDIKGRRALTRGAALDALHCYQAMLQLAPVSAPAHYGLGLAARDAGQFAVALQHLAQAVQSAPDNQEYRLELGRAALRLEQTEEAVRQFRAVLAREPKNAEALYQLSCALASGKGAGRDVQQAMRLAEQACLISQWSNAEYVWGLADRYIDAGMIQEGITLKRKLKCLGYRR